MTTWIGLWPLLVLPSILMIALGAVVTMPVAGHEIGGAAVQHWCVVHLLLDWLPGRVHNRLAIWFSGTDALHRWILYLLIVANVNTFLLPLLYGIGEGILRLQAWGVRTDLELKSLAARKGR